MWQQGLFGRTWMPTALLALVVLLGLALRLHGIGFGLPALNDPDELIFELGATRMLTGPTLNPGWFGHPATTTMYVLAAVNAGTFVLGWLSGTYPDPQAFLRAIYLDPGIVMLPGRAAMAVFGALCVWRTWRLGQALDGTFAAIVAALLVACSPVMVHYSQIIRSDMMGTVFMLLCLGSALRIAQHGRMADYGWAALWLALAVASKWPFAITLLAVFGAAIARVRQRQEPAPLVMRAVLTFLALAFVLLLLISPFLVLDYPTVIRNLGGEARTQHLGATGGGLFDNAWWYISGRFVTGLGLPGLLLAAAGLVLLTRDRRLALVILPVLAGHMLIICLHDLRWERWSVPALPLLAIAAGMAASRLVQLVSKSEQAWLRPIVCASLVVSSGALAFPAWQEAAARTNDTRQMATRWADANIPPGKAVLVEHFAFDFVSRPWTTLFPMGDAGCVDARALLDGRVDYRVVEAARGSRSNVDYGTLPASRRSACTPDYLILMELERYRAERDRFPQQWAAYAGLLERADVATVIRPQPGISVGPVITILRRR